jgi:DHA1 family inner membrane transport protein
VAFSAGFGYTAPLYVGAGIALTGLGTMVFAARGAGPPGDGKGVTSATTPDPAL